MDTKFDRDSGSTICNSTAGDTGVADHASIAVDQAAAKDSSVQKGRKSWTDEHASPLTTMPIRR